MSEGEIVLVKFEVIDVGDIAFDALFMKFNYLIMFQNYCYVHSWPVVNRLWDVFVVSNYYILFRFFERLGGYIFIDFLNIFIGITK